MNSLSKYRQVSFTAEGGIPNDDSEAARLWNTELLTELLNEQAWQTVVVDGHFHLYHGVHVIQMQHLELQISQNSVLAFHRDWQLPNREYVNTTVDQDGRPPACLSFFQCHNVTITSSSSSSSNTTTHTTGQKNQRGIIHGGGPEWWGIPVLGYAQILEHRPYLIVMNHTSNIHMHDVVLQDAPFYHLQLTDADNVHLHDMSIVSRRSLQTTHGLLDLSAFNTDGIDIAGQNVHVHDVDIWTQDDCIAVKDNKWNEDKLSSDMVFERIHASGLGLTIGSISGSTVQNITFRDSLLYQTYKGIYTKFRSRKHDYHEHGVEPHSVIQDVLYQNITMIRPLQWAIWIGPAQQNGGHTANPCHASPCSLCWPHVPGAACDVVPNAMYQRITLRDINIINPVGSPGILQGSDEYPIRHLVLDNVRVHQDARYVVSEQQLAQWFPALSLEVHDPTARRTQIAFWLVLVLAGIVVLCQCWRFVVVRHHHQATCWPRPAASRRQPPTLPANHLLPRHDQEIWAPHCGSKQRILAMLVLRGLVALPVLGLAWFELVLARRMLQVDQYFVCQGIVNGTATGSTWPVPDCLQDETNHHSANGNRDSLHSNPWGGLFWMVIGVVTTIWWLKVVFWKQKANNLDQSLDYVAIEHEDMIPPPEQQPEIAATDELVMEEDVREEEEEDNDFEDEHEETTNL